MRYADARENVVAVTSSVQRVAEFIPGVRVPEGAGDNLTAVDDKLKAIDDAIVATWTSVSDAQPGKAVADALAGRATPLKDALTAAATAVTGLSTNIQGAAGPGRQHHRQPPHPPAPRRDRAQPVCSSGCWR